MHHGLHPARLSYAYDALEPHIDAATMKSITKHHQTYINNVNAALEGTEYADLPVEELVKKLKSLPENLQGPVRNNGGHANHSLFWTVMARMPAATRWATWPRPSTRTWAVSTSSRMPSPRPR
jgi:superoxide dismutase